MRVAWLCPFPLWTLREAPVIARRRSMHPSSWIVNLARALVATYRELDLHIITESTHVTRSLEWEEGGITFHVARSGSAIPFIRRGYPPILPLPALTCFYRNVAILNRILDQVNPELVHAHGTEGAYSLTGIRSRYRCIVTLQGIISYLAQEKRNVSMFVTRRLEKEVLYRGRYFVAKSAFAENFIKTANSRAKIFFIENCVDDRFFNIEPDRNSSNILFVGSLQREKGLEELLVAFSQIGCGRLRLVGEGTRSYVHRLREMSKTLKIEPLVDWLGFMDHEQIVEEYRKACLLVLPSFMETSPNVVAEAMCAGLPVVASAVGGIPSMVIHEKTGLLVEAKQPALLAEAIRRFLGDPRLRAAMGAKGREVAVARFKAELAARKTWEAYQTMLGEHRVKSGNSSLA